MTGRGNNYDGFTRRPERELPYRMMRVTGDPKIVGTRVAVLPHLWCQLQTTHADGSRMVRCDVADIEAAIAKMDYDTAQIARSVFDLPAPWVREGATNEKPQ